MGAGIALEQGGDPAGAAESYRRATELLQTVYEESESPEELLGKAEALTLLGTVLHHSLEAVEAINAYEEAAGIYRRLAESAQAKETLDEHGRAALADRRHRRLLPATMRRHWISRGSPAKRRTKPLPSPA